MKKLIAIITSAIILVSNIGISFPSFAEEYAKHQIEKFTEECIEVSNDYDEGKEFQVVEEETLKDDDLKFQTGRLFVKCASSFNKMGAEEKVSGFLSWHLLQYASPQEAKKAYEYYLKQDRIECVEPDVPTEIELASSPKIDYISKEDFFNDYSRKVMGFDELLPYIESHNIRTKKVRVAVLDSGVDYHHELLQGRLFRTHFNPTDEGNKDDEYEVAHYEAHGTSVTSCVVANTPKNVEVGCYKVVAENATDGYTTSLWKVTALLQALADGCVVVNMSFTTPVNGIFHDALAYLRSQDIALFVGAGNDNAKAVYPNQYDMLVSDENVIVVGASDQCNQPAASFTNSGPMVRFLAPGATLAVAAPENQYRIWSGTSFSTPLAVAEYALLYAVNKAFSEEKLIDLMCATCQDILIEEYLDLIYWNGYDWYGSGILDAIGAFCEITDTKRLSSVAFSLENGNYHSDDYVTLSSSDGADIYYTLDGSIPNRTNGVKYTKPICLDGFIRINAVAVKDSFLSGENEHRYYRGFTLGTDEMFNITEDGSITAYYGTDDFLEIPKTVNGITVTSLKADLFSPFDKDYRVALKALKLPDTIEYLSGQGDNDVALLTWNETIEYFCANNIKNIPPSTFCDCKRLMAVDIPNVEIIEDYAFQSTPMLKRLVLPKLQKTTAFPFDESGINQLYAPNLYTYQDDLITNTHLWNVDISGLTTQPDEEHQGAFILGNTGEFCLFLPNIKTLKYPTDLYDIAIPRLEFSSIEVLNTLPQTASNDTYFQFRITTPHTLKQIGINFDSWLFKNAVKHKNAYTLFGSKGCYAEQWAKENGVAFAELRQDTAIVTDVRQTCNEYTQMLFFDSLGFNKTYQWYGNFEESTENGIPLDGATKELLQLQDYTSYPYYYCICTSTDKDKSENFEHRELIYSRICRNMDYQPADYTEYEKAVDKANSLDRSKYKDFAGVDEALAVDVSNLPAAEQAKVDEQTKAILEAIAALELIEEPSKDTTEATTNESATEESKSTTENTTKKHETTNDNTTTERETKTNSTATTNANRTMVRRDTSLISPNTGGATEFLVATFSSFMVLLALGRMIKKRQKS